MVNRYANDFNDSVRIYYSDLGRSSKPISRKEEEELMVLAKQGDIQARNKILNANCRFVFDTAKKFTGQGASMDDLIGEGNAGMIKAIERFDTSKGVKFITYAVWYIRQAMQDYVKRCQLVKSIESDEDTLTVTVLKAKSDDGDKLSACDVLEAEEPIEQDMFRNERIKGLLNEMMSVLTEREKDIMALRYGLTGMPPMTLEKIGERHSMSKERVRQICMEAFGKLQQASEQLREKSVLIGLWQD